MSDKDTIYRQDAINAITEYGSGNSIYMSVGELKRRIETLPSAQPEPKWTSCSERLPENKSYVLTTIHVPGRQPHARSGWYEDGYFFNDNGDTWRSIDKEVNAWMPLPEPWKEGE